MYEMMRSADVMEEAVFFVDKSQNSRHNKRGEQHLQMLMYVRYMARSDVSNLAKIDPPML